MNTIIRRNHIKNGRLRLAVWKDKKIHAAVIARSAGRIGKKGYTALISSVIRPKTKYSHVKSMDYFVFRQALQEAKSRGYDEAILLNRNGQLVEGSTTNLFFVKNGILFTPSTRCGCLIGIVRQIILDCARAHNIPVQTGAYSIKDLQKADEAFITNSLIGVKPLVSVDGHGIGKTSIGAVTAKLRRIYHHYINKNL